jgi:hypothetical protein
MRQTLVVPDPLADLARLAGVPSAVAAALDSVDAVLRDRGRRAVPPGVAAGSLLAGARANAELTGEGDRWLPGAVRLSAELGALAEVVRVAPAQALARAHVLAARGAVPDEALGRLRASPEAVARLEDVSGLLTGSTEASALVLAAVVHAELATVQPFGSADGLVARAAEHLVLIAAGVDPQGLVPVEAGHAASGEAYAAGLQGYAHGGVAGVQAWLVQCTTALGRGAELLGARLAAPGPAGT